VVAPTTAVPDEHRLGGGLEGVARAVVLLEEFLGDGEVGAKPKSRLTSASMPGICSMVLSSYNRLGVCR